MTALTPCVLLLLFGIAAAQFGRPSGWDFWNGFRHSFGAFEQQTREHMNQMQEHFRQTVSHLYEQPNPMGDMMEDPLGSSVTGPQDQYSFVMDEDKEPVVMGQLGGPGEPGPFHTSSMNLQPVSSIFGFSTQQWWNGPNVCVDREEIDENEESDPEHKNKTEEEGMETSGDGRGFFGMMRLTSCRELDNEYECTTKIRSNGVHKTITVRHGCCFGFRRVAGEFGCVKVDLRSLQQTVSDLGANDFLQMINSTRLQDKLTNENLTLFVPDNDAITEYTEDLEKTNSVEFYLPEGTARRRRSVPDSPGVRELLLSHMVPGFLDTSDFVDEQVLYSESNNSSIRMNIYSTQTGRVLTANCFQVTAVDNYAINGVVHMIDGVMVPIRNTVGEIITNDPQFSILKSIVNKADFMTTLKEPGHFTLFAPTDAAFNKLNLAVREKLFQGEGCVMNILKNLMLPNVVCSGVIQQRARTINFLDEFLVWERNEDDKIFVNGVQIVARDIMGTNGVIHVIDEVLIPDSAQTFTTVLQNNNLTGLLDRINVLRLNSYVDTMTNITLLAPTNEAFKNLPESVSNRLQNDQKELRNVLMYHIVGPHVNACALNNNQVMETGLTGSSVRVNLYTSHFLAGQVSHPTVQCARVIALDKHVCGGVIHVIDRVLLPPAGNIVDTLKTSGNFTILLQLIEKGKLEAKLSTKGPFTLLAPEDASFHKLPENIITEILQDEDKARHLVQQHVLEEMLCCTGITKRAWFSWNRKHTLDGNTINIRRSHHGKLHAGHALVTNCDETATNGVIHTISEVLAPRGISPHRQPVRRFGIPGLAELLLF